METDATDAAAQGAVPVTEESLKALMRDPRYWKHQDPGIVDKVREGFRKLYNEKGNQPVQSGGGAAGDRSEKEESLKALMRDPRYWKHQDPGIVDKVRKGFRDLYQSGPG